MAPYKKTFRTYSRADNNISGVTAFNLLLAKNLTQKKLSKRKNGRRKNDIKMEFKELPPLIKSVVSDESLHVNLEDTFDRLRNQPVLKKPVYIHMQPSSVNDCTNVSEVSVQVQKLRSFKGKSVLKVSNNDTSCSWFLQQTPTGEAITNSLEIDSISKKYLNNSKVTANKTSSIVLRSHSQSLPKSTPIKLNKKTNCSVAVNSTINEVYSSSYYGSPIFGKDQPPISPIVPKDKPELQKCILESLKEIKSWSCSSQSFCNENKSMSKSIVTGSQNKSTKHSSKELHKNETSKDDISVQDISIVRPLKDFEQFESKFCSTLNTEVSSILEGEDKQFNRFVTDRKRKLTTSVQKKMLKDFLVVLDKSQINFSKDRLKLPTQPDYILKSRDKTKPRTKQLTINITKCSLTQFKAQQRRLSRRLSHPKPCRKFSSNSRRASSRKFAIKQADTKEGNDSVESVNSGTSKKEYLCQILKVTSDGTEASSVRECSQRSSVCLKSNSHSSNSLLGTSLQAQAPSSKISRLVTLSLDLNGDSDEELVTEPPPGNATTTTSLSAQTSSKTKQLTTRKSSRTKSFDISKKEYLCKLINVSSDDDDSMERSSLLKNNIFDSLLPPEKPVIDQRKKNSNIIDLVSDEETDVGCLNNDTTSKIGRRKPTLSPSVIENASVKPRRMSSRCTDNGIFQKPSGKFWRPSLKQQKKQITDLESSAVSKITRMSTIIVPAPESNKYKRKTVLLNYAESSLPLGDITNRLSKATPEKSTKSLSGRELVLQYCSQSKPEDFNKIFSDELLAKCKKIAEGTFGEVFMYTQHGSSTVMKVIPIEGDLIVNGEKQKKFDEILSEVVIVSKLSNLRNGVTNKTTGFCQVQRISCVKGRYPDTLVQRWQEYKIIKGTENDPPDNFDNEQLYIVLELSNAGQDLESFVFTNAQQAISVFKQVAYTLAVAEAELKFEHRDLHWGNVLVKKVEPNEKVTFTLRGQTSVFKSNGVLATLIDFTLSRIESEGVIMFLNLADDPYLFKSFGDYQFDIYRLMQRRNGNDWKAFVPFTNVLWLHYLLDKSVTALRYKNRKTKIHSKHLDLLKHYKELVLNYDSVSQLVDKFL